MADSRRPTDAYICHIAQTEKVFSDLEHSIHNQNDAHFVVEKQFEEVSFEGCDDEVASAFYSGYANAPFKLSKLQFWRSYPIIPDTIPFLVPHIRTLEIFCHTDLEIPDALGKLSKLTHLQLGNHGFRHLPDSICNLSELRLLDLSCASDLRHLPDKIRNLSNLEILEIGTEESSHLEGLPDSIGRLTDLTRIDVVTESSAFAHLPDSVGCLGSLKRLSIWARGFHALPANIGNLTNLETLTLDVGTSMPTLPESLGNLAQVRFFFRGYHVCFL